MNHVKAAKGILLKRALKKGKMRGGEISRGLARIKNPEGLILAYATQYLETASDGDPKGDSPFTSALLANIATPGLDVKDLFFRVGSEVVANTGGRQRPEISVSFYEPFSLVPNGSEPTNNPPDPTPKPAGPAAPEVNADESFWSVIRTDSTPKALRDYLQHYPGSPHRREAETRLAAIDEASWRRAASTSDTAVVYEYISAFPSGSHLQQARARIAALEAAPVPSKPRPPRRPKPQTASRSLEGRAETRRRTEQQPGSMRYLPTQGGDATLESFSVSPPRSLPFGAVVSITTRDGRKMTCIGGNGQGTQRRCTWN